MNPHAFAIGVLFTTLATTTTSTCLAREDVERRDPASSSDGMDQVHSGRLMSLYHFVGGDRPIDAAWLNPAPDPATGVPDAAAPDAATEAAKETGTTATRTIAKETGTNNLTPAGVPAPPRSGTWGGQPLALVTATATTSAVSAPNQEAFILTFDPLNPMSRSAFAKAQWIMAGRGHEVDLPVAPAPQGTTDRLEVRGKEDSRKRAAESGVRADRNSREKTSEAGAVPVPKAETNPSWLQSFPPQGTSDEREVAVRITGRALESQGMKILQITGIEEVMPASAAATVSGATDSKPQGK